MAAIVASALLQVIFEKLASEAVKKVVRSKAILSELANLERTLSHIQALLNDASRKEITDEAVKRWLDSLQHLAYDIDDILDGLATDAMHREFTEGSSSVTSKVKKFIPTFYTNVAVDNRLRHKLENIITKLQDLEKEKNTLGLIRKNEESKNINRKFQTSLVDISSIVGREEEKEALVRKLVGNEPRDQNFSVVPIVGMGGVGKTTLARLLYDEKQVTDHFELRAWVCVSDEFDSFSISKIIFQSVGGVNKEFADLNLLQVALRDQIMKKRLLLVLDDVWTESSEDWKTLVGPFHTCAPGSKIIMTTRKEQLLKKLGYNSLNHLQSLSHDDALCLFTQHALGVKNFDSHLKLKPYGEGIVKKCDGLPLALIALGRLLRTKEDEEEYWKKVLNSEIWRLQDGGGIVPALRLSYHDLSAHLKQLFAYCSLFPKDYLFDKEKLVLLWMAEGFLHNSNPSMTTTEQLGREYFDELLSRSFFHHAPTNELLFVMHDLMNDLATSVAGDFFVRFDNEMDNEIRKETLERYRHMSFLHTEYVAYKKFVALKKAKSLRTFLSVSIRVNESWQKFYLSNKILDDLLPKLPLLRVLSLSGYEIREVPEFIGGLKHLRYLNLSQTKITHLPENVCNLYNLQTLIVFGCHDLVKLPERFTKLKNLRHFDIRDTPLLQIMPLGIGEMKSLQTLSKIIIRDENGLEITELKGLKNLCGKISIVGLERVKNAIHLRESNFSQKIFSELELEWSDDVFNVSRKEMIEKEVLNELEPHHDNLKKLKIVSYGGRDLPNWVGDPSFHQLKHVSIRDCKKCIYLPRLGQLPSLKELYIVGLHRVKIIGSDLLGRSSVAFRSLEILSFENMQGWEIWSTNGGVGVLFPCLEELSIKECPNLNVISLGKLPSLRVLKVNGCCDGVLRSLVHVAFSSVTNLEISDISGLNDEVWGYLIESLGKVKELRISWCNEIRYLWESECKASKDLVNLRKLEVWNCNKLVSLGEKGEEDNGMMMTSLRTLDIYRCNSMECCSCPGSIETLRIEYCDSMTDISFPKGGGEKLKSLWIDGCTKLLEKKFGGGEKNSSNNTSMPMLEFVWINGWVNLKTIIELNCYVHLTTLRIKDCESLESFPDHQLLNLTSLINLEISNCPSIDASFPSSRVVWPPKLQTLQIGELKKPMSEWGSQNYPTSLVELTLHGGSDDVNDISKLSHLLPSSLAYLNIRGFQELKRVSKGLQHLTSLEHLHIWNCPNVEELPVTLLPSFLSLTIWWCPKLKERCTRKSGRGYWPRISHIPKIEFKLDEDIE